MKPFCLLALICSFWIVQAEIFFPKISTSQRVLTYKNTSVKLSCTFDRYPEDLEWIKFNVDEKEVFNTKDNPNGESSVRLMKFKKFHLGPFLKFIFS